jgi:hypothetical protein
MSPCPQGLIFMRCVQLNLNRFKACIGYFVCLWAASRHDTTRVVYHRMDSRLKDACELLTRKIQSRNSLAGTEEKHENITQHVDSMAMIKTR